MLNVLMIAAENAALPKGKVGGIGDVIRDVPQFLAREKVRVGVITPGYQIHAVNNPATLKHRFTVPFGKEKHTVELFQLDIAGEANVTQWVLEHEILANAGAGQIYCDDGPARPFASDATKFAFFCSAVCELLCDYWKDQFNVIHLHDWHAAFVAILRAYEPKYRALKKLRTVYTIHNLAIQGTRPLSGDDSSLQSWFPQLKYNRELIIDPRYRDCVNPARAGINLSDRVHAVSPTYAKEILRVSDPTKGTVGGEGLHADLQVIARENRLFGILNGCSYDTPLDNSKAKGDIHSAPKIWQELRQQTRDSLMELIADQRQMRSAHFIALEHLKLLEPNLKGPLVTSIGRLTAQKVKLLLLPHGAGSLLDHLLTRLAQVQGVLFLVGSGDPTIEMAMVQAMTSHNNFIFVNGYCEELPDRLYQLGDLFLMPSSMEPCGISQMLAMRAGQPCLVNQTGGLSDTVSHLKSGFVFTGENDGQRVIALCEVFDLALRIFNDDKIQWQRLVDTAAKQRFLWQDSVKRYIKELYS